MMRQKSAPEKSRHVNQSCTWNCCLGMATPWNAIPCAVSTFTHFYGYQLDQHNWLPSNLGSKLKTTNLSLSEIYPLPFELHKIKNSTEANYKAAHHCWETLKLTAQGRFLMHFPPIFLLHCLWACWLCNAQGDFRVHILHQPSSGLCWASLSAAHGNSPIYIREMHISILKQFHVQPTDAINQWTESDLHKWQGVCESFGFPKPYFIRNHVSL